MNHHVSLKFLCSLALLFTSLVMSGSTTVAQNLPKASRNRDLSKIDAKASKVNEVFVRNALEMAAEYEKAGDVARAVDYLHAITLVQPGMARIEAKLKQLREAVLGANDYSFRYVPTATWGKPVAFVKSGKPFRVAVEGGYKLSINMVVGPDGFAEDDGKAQLIKDTPLGKLVGVIVEDPTQAKKKKKVAPFEIGSGRDIRPRQSGYLFLKVNVPPESKLGGSLQVQFSGYVLSPDGQNIGK